MNNEIQQAFEKWVREAKTKYSLEHWNEEWTANEARHYASVTTEMDYRIFEAGWEARGGCE